MQWNYLDLAFYLGILDLGLRLYVGLDLREEAHTLHPVDRVKRSPGQKGESLNP